MLPELEDFQFVAERLLGVMRPREWKRAGVVERGRLSEHACRALAELWGVPPVVFAFVEVDGTGEYNVDGNLLYLNPTLTGDRDCGGALSTIVHELRHAGPEDIARAALQWAQTGTMPAEPEVLGESPASLSPRFSPSQVFTGLILLRSDPHVGLRVVSRGIDRTSGKSAATPVELQGLVAADASDPAVTWFQSVWVATVGGGVAIVGAVLELTNSVSTAVGAAVVAVGAALAGLGLGVRHTKDRVGSGGP